MHSTTYLYVHSFKICLFISNNEVSLSSYPFVKLTLKLQNISFYGQRHSTHEETTELL